MNIKERIKQARKAASLSQQQLAQLLNVSFMTVRRWETGEVSPRVEEIQKLANALDTSIEYLMGLINAPQPSETSEQTLGILQLNEKLKNEESTLENHIYGGATNNMLIIKDGEREYLIPNNEEGRKLFLSVIQSALKGMGVNATTQEKALSINNGSNSIYKDSTVHNGVPTVANQGG